MLFFLDLFLETERAGVGDQVHPQAQEVLHDSSTDSCLTFPYSSNSPTPFPPSPVHYVSVSPEGVSPLSTATDNPSIDNVVTHSAIVHTLPIPISSTIPISRSSQTHPSILLSPITSSQNTPLYPPYPPISFPQAGPSVFAEFLPSPLTLDLHFLTLFPCLLNPCLPWSLPELYLFPSLLLDLSPALCPDLSGGQSGFPGTPLLEGGELPGAEEAKLLPLPAVKPLLFPATFGLIFNPGEPPVEVPPLMVP